VGTGSASDRRLSREQVGQEVTWSAGAALDASEVARAFGGARPDVSPAFVRDAMPGSRNSGVPAVVVLVVVLIVVIVLVSRCSGDDCDEVRATYGESSSEYRQCLQTRGSGSGRSGSGGSFGGWSSGGGGHK
jgi:uncharacterized membrane protein YgcG